MVGVLCVAAVFRLRSRRLLVAATIGVTLGGLALLFGYVGWTSDFTARGFGHYTTDLLSVVNPGDHSRIFPGRASREGVSEDLGWIGTGAVVLAIGALVLGVRPRPRPRRVISLLCASTLLAIFAASPRVAVLGHVVVDLSRLYEPFASLTGAFRVAGRFVWPLTYTIVACAMAVWILRRPRLAPWALLGCGLIQVADMKDLMFVRRWANYFEPAVWSAGWERARGDFDHLALYPPRCADTSAPCCPAGLRPSYEDLYLATLATRTGLTLNSGGTARAARSVLAPYCAALVSDVTVGRLDPRTIYRVAPSQEHRFRNAVCGRLDGELTCVSREARGPFRDVLEEIGRADGRGQS
jgi:hypothetical protein